MTDARVAQLAELRPQNLVVLDDPVVNQGDVSAFRAVWVCVYRRRRTVRGPPCVPDPAGASQRLPLQVLLENCELTCGLADFDLRVPLHRDSG